MDYAVDDVHAINAMADEIEQLGVDYPPEGETVYRVTRTWHVRVRNDQVKPMTERHGSLAEGLLQAARHFGDVLTDNSTVDEVVWDETGPSYHELTPTG
jgi:hypothetical protein